VTEHIEQEQAIALMALPEHDAQRRRALSHAAGCEHCRGLLAEGAQQLLLIEESAPLPVVSRALKERVTAAVWQPPDARWSRPLRWLLSIIGLISLALVLRDGHLEQPLSAELGLHCLGYELGLGLAPLPVAALVLRLRRVHVAPLPLVALTTSFAFVGQLLLRTRCEASGAGLHLLAFHFGGIVLAGLLAAATGHLLTRRAAP
jgi:hypothetical protein